MLGTFVAGFGARDQTLIARLGAAQGRRVNALAAALVVCFATAAFAAWAGFTIAPMLSAPGRLLLAWLVLVLAGVEMLAVRPGKAPKEPTHSLGAMAFVLVAYQVTGAARLLIFAVTVMTVAPVPAAVGGTIGGAITLSAAWLAPQSFTSPHVRLWRRLAGIALLVLAAALLLRRL